MLEKECEVRIGHDTELALVKALQGICRELEPSCQTWKMRVEFNIQEDESGEPMYILEGAGSVTPLELCMAYLRYWRKDTQAKTVALI